ncbi:hypothetical protein LMG31884_47570 (plasmid) [Xanthomonas hydrangeae]|uniref:hypothetical protein n=1 Tax=Xanthomonas hydrangeae TaxID=2775159 RepID=UPI00196315D5|nr:hypothetical protein LMG31884_47570 [Xanthomonas hydrangeae]CAD7741334.1 hypothetical protein LMG31884_47570 [Xanthomonas hydrangeae]CAD7747910.1 hypothetical protein LMG31887_46260 [Xanthomonas hydrangeae]CAD7747911.1 hypothetical protein LMG31887_46260 [Xanthomonas hydrangeae]CAD7748212.1 hypothetical protein LMG31885_45230 [Xanthomonas hydrangeae]
MSFNAENLDPGSRPMRLRDAIALYAACLLLFAALIALAIALNSWNCLGFAVVAYFFLGGLMSRKCLRGLVEFHPLENTVGNIAETKLKLLIFWPISYVVLLFMLAVDRIL